ncbi:hypothetical protein [Rhizobium mesoamericanum]|uniref:hypothetical protein n=1 Tax=Rhizobium mesoamericanum TaxID=1079800 RepID=UPI0002EC6FC5|nr:hypothetical protein [Rhizobium mesoamericanum]
MSALEVVDFVLSFGGPRHARHTERKLDLHLVVLRYRLTFLAMSHYGPRVI